MSREPEFQAKRAAFTGRALKMSLDGPTGCGKTWTALTIAEAICPAGKRVLVIDTEHHSAELYARDYDFDHLPLDPPYHPDRFVDAIRWADRKGSYGVVVIDSITHAWAGQGGCLELVDQIGEKSGNKFAAWSEVTPLHRRMIDTITDSKIPIIVTMRAKMESVQEGGKVKKIGMAPIQRDDFPYECDVTASMTVRHAIRVEKTRYRALDKLTDQNPGREFALKILKAISADATQLATAGAPPVSDATPARAQDSAGTSAPAPTLKGVFAELAEMIGRDHAKRLWAERVPSITGRSTPEQKAEALAVGLALIAREHVARAPAEPDLPWDDGPPATQPAPTESGSHSPDAPAPTRATPARAQDSAGTSAPNPAPPPAVAATPAAVPPSPPEGAPPDAARWVLKAGPDGLPMPLKAGDFWAAAKHLGIADTDIADVLGEFGEDDPRKLTSAALGDAIDMLHQVRAVNAAAARKLVESARKAAGGAR